MINIVSGQRGTYILSGTVNIVVMESMVMFCELLCIPDCLVMRG